MKVAILTMFNGLDSTYSLVNVVAEQIKMLLTDDIKPIILVSASCPLHERSGIFLDDRIEWRTVTNHIEGKQITWRDYSQPDGVVHDSFFQEADVIADDLVHKLQDVETCIMHDIHYQGWHLLHNVAVRKAQKELPNVTFIAFTHSAPLHPPKKMSWPFSARFTPMPNTKYVYPTQSGISALAKQYNVAIDSCRVVNNSLDLVNYMSDDVKLLATKTDLLSPDILAIYPGRLTTGKKFDKVASLCGSIKKTSHKTVKVIFCDFPSTDIDTNDYKMMIRATGNAAGLDDEDMFFTSDIHKFTHGFPRKGVLELFSLSNIFICPSYSESFGLTVLEAASKGNLIILNQMVPALKEIGRVIHAYFMKWDARNFGFDTRENYIPSEAAYMEEHARTIDSLLSDNNALHAKTIVRQQYSPQWIWNHQLKPLL